MQKKILYPIVMSLFFVFGLVGLLSAQSPGQPMGEVTTISWGITSTLVLSRTSEQEVQLRITRPGFPTEYPTYTVGTEPLSIDIETPFPADFHTYGLELIKEPGDSEPDFGSAWRPGNCPTGPTFTSERVEAMYWLTATNTTTSTLHLIDYGADEWIELLPGEGYGRQEIVGFRNLSFDLYTEQQSDSWLRCGGAWTGYPRLQHDISVSVAAQATVTVGQPTTVTVTVRNLGQDPAYLVGVVSDFEGIPFTRGVVSVTKGVVSTAGKTLLWSIEDFSVGAEALLVGVLTPTATGSYPITARTQVLYGADPVTVNNTSTVTLTVQLPAQEPVNLYLPLIQRE